MATGYILASCHIGGGVCWLSDRSREHTIWHSRAGIGKPKYLHKELGDGIVRFMEKIENYRSASAVPCSIQKAHIPSLFGVVLSVVSDLSSYSYLGAKPHSVLCHQPAIPDTDFGIGTYGDIL